MDSASHIKSEAGKCVACGLCLPHCPTYGLFQDESESPRGRLALMTALAQDRLALNDRLETHLDRCLGCRACERVCPAYVDYGHTLVAARGLIESKRTARPHSSTAVALLRWLVQRPNRMRFLAKSLRGYQRSGLQNLLRRFGLLRWIGLADLDAAIPPVRPAVPLRELYLPDQPERGRVALFLGCQAELSDQPALHAAIRVLNRLGYTVRVPREQTCCGALHAHAGRTSEFTELMQKNSACFANEEVIVGVASGCTAMLRDYEKYPRSNGCVGWAARVWDINHFLATRDWPTSLRLRPLPRRVAVHDPCTLANVLRQEKSPYALLARIPQAQIHPLSNNRICCGAAGTYHLTQVDIARKLRAPKIEELRRLAPDILTTSNPGCALFLEAGLREAGMAIEVLHPVVLLERQLET